MHIHNVKRIEFRPVRDIKGRTFCGHLIITNKAGTTVNVNVFCKTAEQMQRLNRKLGTYPEPERTCCGDVDLSVHNVTDASWRVESDGESIRLIGVTTDTAIHTFR